MISTRKGNGSGLVHRLEISTAKVHDSQNFDELLQGEERAVLGDKGYVRGARPAISHRAQRPET